MKLLQDCIFIVNDNFRLSYNLQNKSFFFKLFFLALSFIKNYFPGMIGMPKKSFNNLYPSPFLYLS